LCSQTTHTQVQLAQDHDVVQIRAVERKCGTPEAQLIPSRASA